MAFFSISFDFVDFLTLIEAGEYDYGGLAFQIREIILQRKNPDVIVFGQDEPKIVSNIHVSLREIYKNIGIMEYDAIAAFDLFML